MKFKLRSDILQADCPWLPRDLKKDEEVFEFEGHTFGVEDEGEIACSFYSPRTIPFFVLPASELTLIPDQPITNP